MNKKLNAKDFILIGVLTALMWIICMIISTVMSIAGPVTNVFYPAVVAIPNGIVMMLLLVLDGELRETQIANYFSTSCRIDGAVPSANAFPCRRYGTLLPTGNLP